MAMARPAASISIPRKERIAPGIGYAFFPRETHNVIGVFSF